MHGHRPLTPQAGRIVRCTRRELWGEQPRIRVSVRAIAAEQRPYSDIVTPALDDGRVAIAMRVELKPFDFAQAVARAGLRPDGTPLARPAAAATAGTSFQNVMTQALGAVSQSQRQAEGLQRELQLDNPAVSLEQTMVAMQKAQIGFQGVLAVRNRLVSAYSEIMNMQV
jgi:flagellar hook-basal body complex protein FliE